MLLNGWYGYSLVVADLDLAEDRYGDTSTVGHTSETDI